MSTLSRCKNYSVPGSYTLTVPSGVKFLKLTGRGGSGGGANGYSNSGSPSNYAAQGCVSETIVVPVKPRDKVLITVGAKGLGGAATHVGVGGTFNDANLRRDGQTGEDSSVVVPSTSKIFYFRGGGGGRQTVRSYGTLYNGGPGGSGGGPGANSRNADGGPFGAVGPGFAGGGAGDGNGGTGGNIYFPSGGTPRQNIDAPNDNFEGGGGGAGGLQFNDFFGSPEAWAGKGGDGTDGYVRVEW